MTMTNRMTKIATIAIFILSAVCFSFAQTTPGTRAVRKIEAYLEKLDKVGYSGTVLVALDGKPVISRGYGFSDEEQKVRNSAKTVSDIGSITKQFTAAAILTLEMQGKLSTNDKIAKYFQNVPADKEGITIHHLLRHSSGLRSGVGGDFEKISEAEFVEKVLNSPLRGPVGERFGYSNIGYSLLALIVEKVSGQSYERYLYENLWKPAKMETTGYSRPNFDKSLIAVGYRGEERWGRPTDKEWAGDAPYLHLKGNGGVLSTTGDLLKWDRALMSNKVLSSEAKKKYYHPVLREDEMGNSWYAYGWDVTKTPRGTRRVWHNGTNRIFYSDFYRFIDEGVTIIVMTNKAQQSFNDTGRVISRIIFEPDYEALVPVPDNAANRALTEQTLKLALEMGLDVAVESYRKRGKSVDLLESVVNAKGYDLMNENKMKEAIELFRLNTIAFPRSGNAFESLGEVYLEAGDKVLGIENYKKSLALDPENGNVREVLKRLQK